MRVCVCVCVCVCVVCVSDGKVGGWHARVERVRLLPRQCLHEELLADVLLSQLVVLLPVHESPLHEGCQGHSGVLWLWV